MKAHLFLFVCAFLSAAPLLAHAEEAKKENCNTCLSGYAELEFNALNTGNALAFSTRDSYGSTYPTKETVDATDRRLFRWKSSAHVEVSHRYGELWFSPYGDWSDFSWPRSIGLRYSILARLKYARMKVGIYHHSAHNVVEERYGKGTSITGFYARSTVVREGGWRADVWGLYNFHDDNESPYIFTKNAQKMKKEDLGRMAGAFGYHLFLKEGAYQLELPIVVAMTKEKLASAKVRSQALCRLRLSGSHADVGPFFEYRRNLSRAEEFGEDEWLLGAAMRFDL